MNATILYKVRKMAKGFLPFYLFTLLPLSFSSCADFFEQDSDHVVYAEDEHLNSAVDTLYSMAGILSKLQAIADRTILLGEVRGDLVNLTSTANADLREMALFDMDDDNMYNQPRDYYAVINNCNYFIEHANIDLRNNRKEFIFLKEYGAVKGIRAWTYLQLVLNYGRVPFVTKPILTKEEAEQTYDMYDLQAVCSYFIDDLEKLIQENTNAEIDIANVYPGYGSIRNTDSRFFYFPLHIVLGDLYLWKASETKSVSDYKNAARCYYNYISQRNGDNSIYPTGNSSMSWKQGSTSWQAYGDIAWCSIFSDETYTSDCELITMIPGDSIRAEGNYSELRNLFNSRDENSYKVSIEPSKRMEEISSAQNFCALNSTGTTAMFAPKGFDEHRDGDLRLYGAWAEGYRYNNGERIETQSIGKYTTRNVHIYRRQMLYLRMAEALNQAGYPRMAYLILSTGLNNKKLETDVYPYYSQSDSTYIAQFDFPSNRYNLITTEDLINGVNSSHNTMGMHSRGSGWTPMNESYQLPEDSTITAEALNARQQQFVDSLILNEGALEFAFEGTRYYDLMRFAKRQANPGEFMVNQISSRMGEANPNRDALKGQFQKLSSMSNWYLHWNGQIGY